jgi:hypothetical protein
VRVPGAHERREVRDRPRAGGHVGVFGQSDGRRDRAHVARDGEREGERDAERGAERGAENGSGAERDGVENASDAERGAERDDAENGRSTP